MNGRPKQLSKGDASIFKNA